MDSNCFALLELLSTAQRTEAQLFAMKYVSVKQSIFIKSCKPRQECSKCSKSSERCTRRAARVRAKVRVLTLTTFLTLGSKILKSVDSIIIYLLVGQASWMRLMGFLGTCACGGRRVHSPPPLGAASDARVYRVLAAVVSYLREWTR